MEMYGKIIMTICLGAELAETRVPIEVEDGTLTNLSLALAIDTLFQFSLSRGRFIINQLFPKLKYYTIMPSDRRHGRNVERVRTALQKILDIRRAKKNDSDNDKSDLMSILMDLEFYQGRDYLIVDEMISVFVGAMKTTQSTTTNLICYMDMNRHVKEKLLEEILPPLNEVRDDILGELQYDTVADFEYLQKVIYETLRIEPALKIPTGSNMTQSCTLNGIKVKPETVIFFNIWNIQRDPNQWREPAKFEPERFNSQSEWYKTPDGKQRNPLAWLPFYGGKRICVGKTFAEVVLRYVVPILYHHYDFELSNSEHHINKPPVNFNAIKSSVIPVKLTMRNPVIFKTKE